MRLNKYIAQATGISRRAADQAIASGQVLVNGRSPSAGYSVMSEDSIEYKGSVVTADNQQHVTIMLNKPVGYICSRDGQGGQTIYDLLPTSLHKLKPVGRLDKNSSGLLLMTTDGHLAHQLTHPSFAKTKVYKIALHKPLAAHDRAKVEQGVTLDDGVSRLALSPINPTDHSNWKVTMNEGRNRQIRRTFDALGYNVVKLHRTHFGPYTLRALEVGDYTEAANG